jgi:DeoR/GlpR family transcriptional regulator of sugar metabolism
VRLTVLADHSKLAKRGPAKLVPTSGISRLIVDDGADAEVLERLREAGVTVETC